VDRKEVAPRRWCTQSAIDALTVVIHVCGRAFIGERFVSVLGESLDNCSFMPKFAVMIGGTALLAILLHGIEKGIGAAAYRFIIGHESKARTSVGPLAMGSLGAACRKPT